MKASELRVGNWVIESTVTFSGIKKKEIQVKIRDLIYADGLQPIELTEDWLVRLGFVSGTTEKLKQATGAIISRDTGGYILYSGHNCLHVRISYVHQLQNLYHALTQHEINDRG